MIWNCHPLESDLENFCPCSKSSKWPLSLSWLWPVLHFWRMNQVSRCCEAIQQVTTDNPCQCHLSWNMINNDKKWFIILIILIYQTIINNMDQSSIMMRNYSLFWNHSKGINRWPLSWSFIMQSMIQIIKYDYHLSFSCWPIWLISKTSDPWKSIFL